MSSLPPPSPSPSRVPARFAGAISDGASVPLNGSLCGKVFRSGKSEHMHKLAGLRDNPESFGSEEGQCFYARKGAHTGLPVRSRLTSSNLSKSLLITCLIVLALSSDKIDAIRSVKGAPVMKVAGRRAALGKGSVYQYYFTCATPVQGDQLRSPHNMEIPFAFDNVQISVRLTEGSPEAMALADKVSDTWIAFARTGNPNTPKLPHWPVVTAKDRATIVLDNTSKVVNNPLREKRIAMFRALNLT